MHGNTCKVIKCYWLTCLHGYPKPYLWNAKGARPVEDVLWAAPSADILTANIFSY